MEQKTPYSRLQDQIAMAAEMQCLEPVDYFRSGNGGQWFLLIAQGLQRLQQYTLACEGVKFGYVYRDGSKAS